MCEREFTIACFVCVCLPVFVHTCSCTFYFFPTINQYLQIPFTRCSSGIVLGCLGVDEVLSKCVLLSMSGAWTLGRAVVRANMSKRPPYSAITESRNGRLLTTGKVRKLLIQASDLYLCFSTFFSTHTHPPTPTYTHFVPSVCR